MTIQTESLPDVLTQVRTKPLFQLREEVPPLFIVGATPNAFRRIRVVVGGSFEGERLSGKVVCGNDWQDVRRDNCTKLDARLLLKANDDSLIVMTYQCLRAVRRAFWHNWTAANLSTLLATISASSRFSRRVPRNTAGSTESLLWASAAVSPTVRFITSLKCSDRRSTPSRKIVLDEADGPA
jgi:hypothetical protein